jgi:hypothetical protein
VPSSLSLDTRTAIASAQQQLNDATNSLDDAATLPPVGGLPARAAVMASLGVPVSQYTFDTLARIQEREDKQNALRSTADAKERRRKRKLQRKLAAQAAAKPNAEHAYKGDDGAGRARRCSNCGKEGHNARTCRAAAASAASLQHVRKRARASREDNDTSSGDDGDDNRVRIADVDDSESGGEVAAFVTRTTRTRSVKPSSQFDDYMM